jgi:hypothetical protein
MSLPTASQNAKFYQGGGCRLACALLFDGEDDGQTMTCQMDPFCHSKPCILLTLQALKRLDTSSSGVYLG